MCACVCVCVCACAHAIRVTGSSVHSRIYCLDNVVSTSCFAFYFRSQFYNKILSRVHQKMDTEKRRSLRPVAFVAVAFAVVSVFACVITLPLVYNYVQSVQSFMQNEVDFCKVGIKNSFVFSTFCPTFYSRNNRNISDSLTRHVEGHGEAAGIHRRTRNRQRT